MVGEVIYNERGKRVMTKVQALEDYVKKGRQCVHLLDNSRYCLELDKTQMPFGWVGTLHIVVSTIIKRKRIAHGVGCVVQLNIFETWTHARGGMV